MPASWRSTVTAAEEAAPGVIQLTLAVEDERFAFVAGQSVTLRLGELRRTYSIASAPQRPSAMQLCIRLGSGEGSAAVQKLFTVIAPRYTERQGGYTRIYKLGTRLGDGADMGLIQFLP